MPRRIARTLSLVVVLIALPALTACAPPTGRELVARFARDVVAIDGIVGGDAEAGPIEIEIDPDLDQEGAARAVGEVVALLESDSYASWRGDALLVVAHDGLHAPQGTELYWSGSAPGSVTDDVAIWFAIREARSDPYQRLKLYDELPADPILVVAVEASELDAEGASEGIEAQYLAAWAQGARADQQLTVEIAAAPEE